MRASLPIPEAPDPKRYVAEVTRASRSSFFLPMLLLPREKREAMLALYAFCRETDDVADEIEDPAQSRALIEAWRGEVRALYQGAPRHPVTRALAAPVERFGLAERHFMEILEGFEMDGGGAMLRPTLAELERYCHCVAGCVGLLSVEIFGYRARTIPTFAGHLGQAFQLTNILRDVAEDAKRGRIYLPQELLERHGLADIGPEAIGRTPGVEKVCGALGGMARRRFGAASEALPRSERRSMRPAILMRSVYEAYLDRIERAGFPVAGRRIRFTATAEVAPGHGRAAADDLAPTCRLIHFPQWRALAYSNPSTAGAGLFKSLNGGRWLIQIPQRRALTPFACLRAIRRGAQSRAAGLRPGPHYGRRLVGCRRGAQSRAAGLRPGPPYGRRLVGCRRGARSRAPGLRPGRDGSRSELAGGAGAIL